MRKAIVCLLVVAATLMPTAAGASAPSSPPADRLSELEAQRDAAAKRVTTLASEHAAAEKDFAEARRVTRKVQRDLETVDARIENADRRLGVLGQISAGVSHGMLTGILSDVFGSQSEAELAVLSESRSELAEVHEQLAQELDGYREVRDRHAAALAEAKDAHRTLARRVKSLAGLRPEIVEVEPGLVEVGGIVVDESLGKSLRALIWHARADGLDLGGYGHRSTERQIELRRQNGCPNIYTSSPSACRIPTARPGTSNHETGLAVDFTIDGDTVCFPRSAAACPSSNPAFRWLVTHAGSYGLKNLPSEAWHWSTTGT